jgi:hypothetical protein
VIDFRYHVVSIVAVLLALTVGLVLGATTLSGAAFDDLNGRVNGLKADKRSLENRVTTLQGQLDKDQRFAAALAPTILGGVLAGGRVVLVAGPEAADSDVSSVATAVRQAGGVVTSTVTLTSAYVDPAKSGLLRNLAEQLVQQGVTLPQTSPYAAAGVVLASSLVRAGGQTSYSDDDRSVLSAFSDAGFLTMTIAKSAPGSLAIVVAGSPAGKTSVAHDESDALVSLVRSLDAVGRAAVLVGPAASAGSNGAIAALRSDGDLSRRISSVDDVDTAQGTIAAMLALAADAKGLPSGQFGAGPGASAPLPTPTQG